MMKWVLYAFLWALALVVSMDFAQKSSRGTSLQAYIGFENPFARDYRSRPSSVEVTSSAGE